MFGYHSYRGVFVGTSFERLLLIGYRVMDHNVHTYLVENDWHWSKSEFEY